MSQHVERLRNMLGAALISIMLTTNAAERTSAPAEQQAAARAAQHAALERKLTAGLARLQPFAGHWSIVSFEKNAEQHWHEKERSTLDFEWAMGSRLLETEGHLSNADFRFSLTYDALKSVYRIALIDSGSGVLDIYQGDFDSDNTLIATNPDFYQWRLKPTANGWEMGFHYSKDQGKTWSNYSRHVLSPRTQ